MNIKAQTSARRYELILFIAFTALFVAAIGYAVYFGFWGWLASLVILLTYAGWWLVRLMRLYHWYRQGSSLQILPNCQGILTLLVKQMVREKRNAERIEVNNKELIQQFRAMVEALPYATLLMNKNLEIKYINERAQQLFDVSQADVGKPLQQVFAGSPVLTLFDEAVISKQQAAKEGFKMAHPMAPERLIKTRLIKANRYRLLLLAHDVSAMEALQQSRKTFIANASHELRTPLTVISGYLEFLQDHNQNKPPLSEAIGQAYEQTKRMSQIIGDMLELSRIEHDQVVSDDEEIINMPELLNHLFKDFRYSADAQNHELSAQIDSTLHLKGSPSEMTSVCLNLLHNAVLHTPADTHIQLHWFEENNQAQLQVRDNGRGIAAEHVPHLTERFYRITQSAIQQQGSTGLGLAIVKHIGIKNGATFHIDSELGQGSCFRMVFPTNRIHRKLAKVKV